jgi:hypothetical protein
MIHDKRVYRVADRVHGELFSTPHELAQILVNYSWCMCNGFRLKHLVFLNDAFSADGAQEYAVFDERTGRQIESLTCSWMTVVALEETIEQLLAEPEGSECGVGMKSKMPSFDHPEGSCHHCA